MTAIRVLLVDDQAMIRSGIRGLLELAEDVVVVGEAADGAHAVSMVRALRPEWVGDRPLAVGGGGGVLLPVEGWRAAVAARTRSLGIGPR